MRILVGVFLISFSIGSAGDYFITSAYCIAPSKPFEFTSQWQVDIFWDEVEQYKSCIGEFVDKMSNQAQKHQDAASNAIDEWNNFVEYELN